MHDPWPATSLKEPAGQSAQLERPKPAWNWPWEHPVQLVEPVAFCTVPCSQSRHALDPLTWGKKKVIIRGVDNK